MDVELTEACLSEETGVSRELLRGLREKKLSAADWARGSRGQIVWEMSGVRAAVEDFPEMAVVLKKFEQGAERQDAPQAGLKAVDGIVTRKFANPRILEALVNGNELIRVKVRDSKNFIKGMSIRVVPPKVKTALWQLEGRCPRWPGRF